MSQWRSQGGNLKVTGVKCKWKGTLEIDKAVLKGSLYLWVLTLKKIREGGWDGSAGKGTCSPSELNAQDPHDGKGEWTPKGCPLTSTHVYTRMYTCAHQISKK